MFYILHTGSLLKWTPSGGGGRSSPASNRKLASRFYLPPISPFPIKLADYGYPSFTHGFLSPPLLRKRASLEFGRLFWGELAFLLVLAEWASYYLVSKDSLARDDNDPLGHSTPSDKLTCKGKLVSTGKLASFSTRRTSLPCRKLPFFFCAR